MPNYEVKDSLLKSILTAMTIHSTSTVGTEVLELRFSLESGDLDGFVTKIIPALTAGDYYHHHNKYTGSRRSALIHLHDAEKGLVSEFTYSI